MLLSMPIFTNSHHTLPGKNEKCFLPITFPHTYHIVRISIWKRTHSLCSMSTTVRLYRQETAADHLGIHVYWAIIQGGIVSCGRMFAMYVRLSIWGLFYFFLIQYSSLRLNTNILTYPPNQVYCLLRRLNNNTMQTNWSRELYICWWQVIL